MKPNLVLFSFNDSSTSFRPFLFYFQLLTRDPSDFSSKRAFPEHSASRSRVDIKMGLI